MVRLTDSRRARNSASLISGARRRPDSRPSLRRCFLASIRVRPGCGDFVLAGVVGVAAATAATAAAARRRRRTPPPSSSGRPSPTGPDRRRRRSPTRRPAPRCRSSSRHRAPWPRDLVPGAGARVCRRRRTRRRRHRRWCPCRRLWCRLRRSVRGVGGGGRGLRRRLEDGDRGNRARLLTSPVAPSSDSPCGAAKSTLTARRRRPRRAGASEGESSTASAAGGVDFSTTGPRRSSRAEAGGSAGGPAASLGSDLTLGGRRSRVGGDGVCAVFVEHALDPFTEPGCSAPRGPLVSVRSTAADRKVWSRRACPASLRSVGLYRLWGQYGTGH